MKINRLPAPTWRWMAVNDSEADIDAGCISGAHRFKGVTELSKGVSEIGEGEAVTFSGAFGEEFDDAMAAGGITGERFAVEDDTEVDAPVCQEYVLKKTGDQEETDSKYYVNHTGFYVNQNSKLTIIQFITSDKKDEDTHKYIMSTRIKIGKNSEVKLIQVQNLCTGVSFFNDCGIVCDENASFEHIQIVLGGSRTYMGDRCCLAGSKSRYSCDIAYDLKGSHTLDMNYIADHRGAKTASDINVSGVMSDTSSKIFRGTIDFHRGCSAAVGSELEDVLLMNDGVTNKTVPLILCDEEDVEGSHGASIGRLDDNLVFYLASRGMDEETIYRTMARARIDKVIALIEDGDARGRIEEMLS